MPLTLHAALVPTFLQLIGSTRALLAAGEAFAAARGLDPADLLADRLAPDMLPFAYQVKSVAVHSAGALAGVRAGVFHPDTAAPPADFAALRDRLDEAAAAVAAVTVDEMEGWIGRPMRFEMGAFRRYFVADEFLLSFSQPNFFFHATTAYALLRARGVPLGKQDYLGAVRTLA